MLDLRQRRFDEAAISRGLGKYLLDERSETLQPRLGIVDIRARERQRSERGFRAPDIGFIQALSWRSCNSLTNSLLLSIISTPVPP